MDEVADNWLSCETCDIFLPTTSALKFHESRSHHQITGERSYTPSNSPLFETGLMTEIG